MIEGLSRGAIAPRWWLASTMLGAVLAAAGVSSRPVVAEERVFIPLLPEVVREELKKLD